MKELVEYQKGQVVSKTLVQNGLVNKTLFSLDKREEISTDAAGGNVMLIVLLVCINVWFLVHFPISIRAGG